MQFSIFTIAGLAALYLSPAISAYAIASPETTAVPDTSDTSPNVHDLKNLQLLEEAFTAFESIPAEVLDSGDDAARVWLKEHFHIIPKDDNDLPRAGGLVGDSGMLMGDCLHPFPGQGDKGR